MNCAYLRGAIEEAVSAYGYTLYQCAEQYSPATICHYPAAHLLPPEFCRIEGRQHGKITYSIELRLLEQGAKLSAEERNEKLSTMESHFVEIFSLLSEYERVASVEELTIKPATNEIDAHGAMTLVAKAEVVTIF